MDQFRNLRSLRSAIHHAALCHRLPSGKRHPHQYRIPAAALREAERVLQRNSNHLRFCKDFEALHEEVAHLIQSIRKIGSLSIYDIAHRIGTYLEKTPRLVFLHRGTAIGARHLGFRGATLDPKLLPAAFLRLSPAEIEDCLCIFKDKLGGLTPRDIRRSCVPMTRMHRRYCGSIVNQRPVC